MEMRTTPGGSLCSIDFFLAAVELRSLAYKLACVCNNDSGQIDSRNNKRLHLPNNNVMLIITISPRTCTCSHSKLKLVIVQAWSSFLNVNFEQFATSSRNLSLGQSCTESQLDGSRLGHEQLLRTNHYFLCSRVVYTFKIRDHAWGMITNFECEHYSNTNEKGT